MSNYKDIDKDIDKIIEKELKSAIDKFGVFKDMDEGIEVLDEEIRESYQACYAMALAYETDASIDDIKTCAIDCIKELVQVAAMCDKFGRLMEDEQ